MDDIYLAAEKQKRHFNCAENQWHWMEILIRLKFIMPSKCVDF